MTPLSLYDAFPLLLDEQDISRDVVNFTRLDFPETAYDVGLGPNYEFATTELILSYDSLITPLESILIDMDDPDNIENRRVLKQKNVPGYDKSVYGCERTTVTSRDGRTEIPISLVYRKDVMEEHVASGKTVPVHLYGECASPRSEYAIPVLCPSIPPFTY